MVRYKQRKRFLTLYTTGMRSEKSTRKSKETSVSKSPYILPERKKKKKKRKTISFKLSLKKPSVYINADSAASKGC